MLGWNLYFLVKALLHLAGKAEFNTSLNLGLFLALVLTAFIVKRLHLIVRWVRHLAFAPIALALLLHELGLVVSWALLGQIQALFNFSAEYLIELAKRSIQPWALWSTLGIFLVLRILDRYLRTTSWVGAMLVLWAMVQVSTNWWQTHEPETQKDPQAIARENTSPAELLALGKPGFEELKALRNLENKTNTSLANKNKTEGELGYNAVLDEFFKQQKKLVLPSPKSLAATPNFDVLILQICSMSWADLQYARQTQHPLIRNADFLFENFNTATSYSGPAAIRLLRGQCGQTEHKELYQSAPNACMAFAQLHQAGFSLEMGLNHNGLFDNFKQEVRKNIGNANNPVEHTDVNMGVLSFDGTPIARDADYLRHWWNKRQNNPNTAVALYYNSITLHDGNRMPNTNQNSLSTYPVRLERLLNDIQNVLGDIQASGRKVFLVVVPEHGAGMTAEYGQLQGLRELPTPAITRVPVFGYWINGKPTGTKTPTALVRQPTSYPALYTLIQRILNLSNEDQKAPPWVKLSADLPSTRFVAQQGNITIMEHQGQHWLKAPGTNWKALGPSKASQPYTNLSAGQTP